MNDTISVDGAQERADEPNPRSWARQRWGFRLGAILGLLGLVVGAGLFIHVPRIAFSPGGITTTETLIEIDGAPSYESAGELFYTTVLVTDLSLLGWLWARSDEDQTVRNEEDIRQGQTSEESRVCSQAMMRLSRSTATVVALTRVGYEVINSTGSGIERVFEESAADGALTCGDVIVAIDGETVLRAEDAVRIIGEREPGAVVVVTVESLDGDTWVERTETIELGENDAGGALLGVRPQTRFDELDIGVSVDIDTGRTGGPSAGLALTLATIDRLVPGDLAGGSNIAVTGTIRIDGSVGAVGGVRQKVIAAREGGADAFLMPMQPRCADPTNPECPFDADFAAMEDDAGSMPIFEVAHLEEALAVLSELGGEPLPDIESAPA